MQPHAYVDLRSSSVNGNSANPAADRSDERTAATEGRRLDVDEAGDTGMGPSAKRFKAAEDEENEGQAIGNEIGDKQVSTIPNNYVGRTLGLRKDAFRKQLSDELSASDAATSNKDEDEGGIGEEEARKEQLCTVEKQEDPLTEAVRDALDNDGGTKALLEMDERFEDGVFNGAQRMAFKKHRVLRVNKNSKTGQVRTSRKQKERLESTRVCIIGAGMAGMSAAKRLNESGVNVTVYEGRGRVGGRICSVDSDGVVGLDVGAGWIHGIKDNPVFEICEQCNIDVYAEEVGIDRTDALYDVNGVEFDKALDEWGLLTHQKHQMEAEEYARSRPDCEAIHMSLGSLLEPKLLEGSCDDPLKHRILDWHMANIEYSTGASASELGLPTWDQDDLTALQGAHVMIKDGYQRVVEALAPHIGIRFNQIVNKVEYDENGVKLYVDGRTEATDLYDFCILTVPLGVLKASVLRTQCSSLDTASNTLLPFYREASSSDAVQLDSHRKCVDLSEIQHVSNYQNDFKILFGKENVGFTKSELTSTDEPQMHKENQINTESMNEGLKVHDDTLTSNPSSRGATNFPENANQHVGMCESSVGCIEFIPPLPEWKITAIGQVGFGLINKIGIIFPYVFWDTSKRQLGWASTRRGQYPQIVLLHPKPAVIVLLTGKFSAESEKRPRNYLVREAMAVLRLIHGQTVVPPPVRAFVSQWGSDPLARGSYSYVPPGVAGRDYDTLSYPVKDRVLFAGEHTMRPYPSTVHGACASGRREADRIIDWITGKLEKEKVQKWFFGPEGDWYSIDLNDIDCQAIYVEDVLEGPTSKERTGWFSTVKCAFCSESQTLERPFSGCFRFKDSCQKERRWAAHEECCYHSPEVGSNNEGSRWYNVAKALKRSACVHCAVCGGPGATIGCSIAECNSMIHLPCARKSLDWPNYVDAGRSQPLLCPDHQFLGQKWHNRREVKPDGQWSNEELSNGSLQDALFANHKSNHDDVEGQFLGLDGTNLLADPHLNGPNASSSSTNGDSRSIAYAKCSHCNGKGKVVAQSGKVRYTNGHLGTFVAAAKPEAIAAVLLRNTVIVLLQCFEQQKASPAVAALVNDLYKSMPSAQKMDTQKLSGYSANLSKALDSSLCYSSGTADARPEDAQQENSTRTENVERVLAKDTSDGGPMETVDISPLMKLFTTVTNYLQRYNRRHHLLD